MCCDLHFCIYNNFFYLNLIISDECTHYNDNVLKNVNKSLLIFLLSCCVYL